MAKKQYSGVRESKPGRINDLGTTGKEVEEQFRKGCLKKADRTFAQGLQCQQINSMAALMSLEDSVFISHSPQGSPSLGCRQLTARAKILAQVVLPVPREPVNR